MLEIKIINFEKNTLKILEPKEIFLGTSYKAMGEEMGKNGVIFVSGQKSGKFAETYAAIYKGVVIEEFSKAELSNFYKKWGKLKGAEMEDALKVTSDNVLGKGLYGGKVLSKADLDFWAKKLSKEYATKLQKVDNFGNSSILAQFDPNTNTILYKDDVTEYFMLHESFHAEEFKKIGFNEYVKDAPLKGVKEVDYTNENWIRLYKREKYVYDKLVQNAKKHELNAEEISTPPFGHAFRYFDRHVVLELEIRKIPIPKK